MDYFNKYGQVDKVTIKYDNVTGRSRGFGFVTFVNMDSVDSVSKVFDNKFSHFFNSKFRAKTCLLK